jgi:hypothetical protein
MRFFFQSIFFALFFLKGATSSAQDSAVSRIIVRDISWQDTLSTESANFRDSINAILDSARTLRDVMMSVRDSMNVVRDSVLKDSVDRHWMGWKKYKVQPSYNFVINSKTVLKGKKKAELQYNIADFYLYLNGQLIKPPKSANSFFSAGCLSFKYDDTLLLNSGLGFKVGVGVGIKIIQGRFSSELHANKHNREIYKQTMEDSVYLKSIIAKPLTQSLKLVSEPQNRTGDVIIGEYQAVYGKFYEKNEDDQDEVRKYTVKIIFRCRTSGGIDSFKSEDSAGGN